MSAPILAVLCLFSDRQVEIALLPTIFLPCTTTVHGKEKLLHYKEYDNIDVWGWFFFGHLGLIDKS